MAKQKYLYEAGFLGTGAVSRTFLAGLPVLAEMLGPVYTPTRRATPRIVTALECGFPVDRLEDLRGCRTLFLCAPAVDSEMLLEWARDGGALAGVNTLVLVEESAAASLPPGVAEPVAEVGRIRAISLRRHPVYLVEGSFRFRRFCQKLLDVPLSRLVLAGKESRAMVEAGLFLAEEFCLPLLEATQAAFVAAGIHREQARELGAQLLRESIENASFAGRKRWTGILHARDSRKLEQIVRALQQENELLANLILGLSRQGLAVMGKDADWIPHLPAAPPNSSTVNGNSPARDPAADIHTSSRPRLPQRRTRVSENRGNSAHAGVRPEPAPFPPSRG